MNKVLGMGGWVGGFWIPFLAMLLIGISCHLAIKRSNFPLPAQSCNMCAADNHIFLAYILSMGTHLFKKWKTMTHHENTLKNHEKQLETMKNHLQPCNMCATDNHNCLAYIRWMKNYISIVQNFFLILTGKEPEVQDCSGLPGTTLDYICKFMCALDNHIFLP